MLILFQNIKLKTTTKLGHYLISEKIPADMTAVTIK